MSVSSLIFLMVSALLGGLNYFLTKNLIFSLAIFLIFMALDQFVWVNTLSNS